MLGQDLHSQLRVPASFRATQLDVRSKDSVDTKPKTLVNMLNQPEVGLELAKEVDLVLMKDKPLLKKIIKGGNTSYKYTGPVNQRIQDFLEDLYLREGPIHHRGLFEKLVNLNTRIDKRLEKIFPKSCTNGPLSLDKDSILLFLLMLGGSIYYATQINAATDGLTSDDSMEVLRVYGTLFTFLFPIYGIIFLSLPIWWAFTVFVLQTTIPVFLILFDFNLIFPRDDVPDVGYTNTGVRACAAILPVYWGVMYPAYKLIRHYLGRFIAHIFIAVVYIGIAIFTIGVPALDLITGKDSLDTDYVKTNSAVIYIVCAILVVLSWVFAHAKYFWVSTSVLENTLMEMAQKQARKERVSKSADVVQEGLIIVPTRRQRIMRNIYWISSLVVGAIYIALEMFLLDSIIKTVESSSTDGLTMSILFFVMTPLFLMIGIPIAMTKARVRNKTLFLPLIIMLPMFGLIPLSDTVEESTSTSGFSLFLIVGLPLIMFFWLGMAFLGLKGRRLFYLILMFMCMFFFLPFVFLGLSESAYFDGVRNAFKVVFYTFIGVFGGVTVVLLTWRSIKFLYVFTKKKLNERRKRLQKKKEELERIKALRKKKQAKEGIQDNDSNNEDEDDDLEMEELERNEGDDGHSRSKVSRNSIFPSRIHGKKRASAHPSARRASKYPSSIDIDGKKRTSAVPSRSDVESKKAASARKESHDAAEPNEEDEPKTKDEDPQNAEDKAKKQLNLLKEVEQKRQMSLVKLMYLNFKNFGFWINAAAFIVSYTFVAYTYYNIPSATTETEKGVLLGVTIVMPVIFVLNNVLIRLKTAKLTAEERKIYKNKKDAERVFFESQLRRDEVRLGKATVLETYALMMGVLVIPLLQIPLFIIFNDRKGIITNLFVMVVSIVFSIFLAGMIEIKKRTGPYNRFFIPSFVSLCWVMVLLPFIVVIPLLATIIDNTSDDFEVFVKVSFTGSAFLLMFGVTFFAIVINVIFHKLEKEKLIKFIIKTLQRTLKEHSVKSDDVVLRRLVEEFLNKDTEEDVDEYKRTIIYDKIPFVPIYPPKFKVTPLYGAGIILVETYNKILQAQQNMKNKRSARKGPKVEKPKTTLFAWLAGLCADKEDEDEEQAVENFDEDQIQEIVGDLEDSYFKADHYLPQDIDENVWNLALGSVTPAMMSIHHTHLTEEDDVPDDYHPVLGLKPTEVDFKLKDAMTPKLQAIVIKPLTSGEIRKLNTNEHALILHENMNQMEVWYQHIFDYFSGKTEPDLNNPSQGLIFQNFVQFLRVAELNQNQEVSDKQLESTFALHATKKAEKGCCLAYSGFIQLLTLVASKAVLDTDDSKLLKRFTKKIYPAIMSRIPQIARSYSGAMLSFGKSKTPYVPHLDLFDKTKIVSIHQDPAELSANDYVLKRREVRRSNAHIMKQINEEPPVARQLSNLVFRNSPHSQAMMSNESFFSHGDKSPMKKKKKPSCIKRVLRKTFLSLNSCWLSFTAKTRACINACFVTYPKAFGDGVYKRTKRLGKALGFDIEVESDNDDDLAVRRVSNEAPSWPIVVDKMFSIIAKAQILYFQKEGAKGVSLKFNLTNLFAIIGKVIEVYNYMAFAFRTDIPWFKDDTPNDVILATNVEFSFLQSFVFLFWTAVGLVFVYLMLVIPAIKHLRKGTLGQDEFGRKASFPHPQFFLTFTITILGGSLFTQIMRYLMNAFVCDYSSTPWVLVNDSSIECLTDEHSLYMGIGILALLIYYPISTFMFPNFQFQSKPLDLKYDPTYIVIQIQARLIITGFVAFFKVNDSTDTASIITQLVGTSATLFLLALISFILKPCLIRRANVLDVAAYSTASWVNICAIIVVIYRNSILGAIMLASGVLVIIAIVTYVIKRYYGSRMKKKKDLLGYVKYDPIKRQALIPEEIKPPVQVEPEPQHQSQLQLQPQSEEVRKRNILENVKEDVSLAYVEKHKPMF